MQSPEPQRKILQKSRAHFGNGVILLDHSATMQCSTRKVKKEDANYGRLFYTSSKVKTIRTAILSGEIKKKMKTCFEPFSTVYFSNPPSYRYMVKETGKKFTSHHENCIKAYKEYLSLKTKKENL